MYNNMKSLTKHIKKLHQKKYRREYGEYLIEGVKGIEEAFEALAPIVSLVVDGIRRDEKDIAAVIAVAEKKEIPIEYCGRKDIGDIKTTDTFAGILAIVAMAEHDVDDLDLDAPIVCLNRVSDPGNLGTIIRTADWFGIQNILLSEGSVDPYNEKVVRSTMGSLFHATIAESESIRETLAWLQKEHGYQLVGLNMNGTSLAGLEKQQKKTVYVFGSESHGIEKDIEKMLDARYTIPGSGEAESLNVAIAAGIVLSRIAV